MMSKNISEEGENERKRDRQKQEGYGKKGSPTKQKHVEGTKKRPT